MATTSLGWFQRLTKRRFVRYGMPFLICIVGGSFALKQFASIRYEFRRSKKITNEEAEKFGITMKNKEKNQSVEDAYEDLKKIDINSWENIRGPRPWEDSKIVQDQQRQKSD